MGINKDICLKCDNMKTVSKFVTAVGLKHFIICFLEHQFFKLGTSMKKAVTFENAPEFCPYITEHAITGENFTSTEGFDFRKTHEKHLLKILESRKVL